MARWPEVTHRRETSGMLGQSLVDWGWGRGEFQVRNVVWCTSSENAGAAFAEDHCPPGANVVYSLWALCPEGATTNNETKVGPLSPTPPARGAQSFTRHIPAAQKPAEATNPSGCLEETSGHLVLGLPALRYFRLLGSSAWIHRGGYPKIKPPTPIRDRTTMRVRRSAGAAGEESDSEQGLLPDCPG